MTKSKHHPFSKFRPEHPGTESRAKDANNGKKMASKHNDQPDYVPPKG